MAKYRKIDPRIWNDAKFCRMSDKGKLAFLFLLTHPHMTALGAMRATLPGLATELNWSEKAFREAFREASDMVECDETSSIVSLPRFLKYNRPESPNVVTSWRDSLDLLPECELKAAVIERALGYVSDGLPEAFAKAFRKAIPEAFAKTMPNQEQEQEQDTSPISPSAKEAFHEGRAGTIAFEMAWSSYPAGKRSKKPVAISAWRNAVSALVNRHSGVARDAEDWLFERIKQFTKSPLAASKFCPSIATWLEDGRYDDADEVWTNGEKPPESRVATKEESRTYNPQAGLGG